MKIKAAVIHGKDEPFVIEEVDLAPPEHGEVLARIVASGVCHTDEAARSQEIPTPLPAVLGHEGSGIIEQVGPGVHGFEVGDYVAFSYAYCGHCDHCSDGKAYACDSFNELNMFGAMEDGSHRLSQNGKPISNFFGQSSFATHTVVNQNNLVKIDPEVDLSLVGPLGCGVQTGAGSVINGLKPKLGSSIAIFGMGGVGMSALMAAKVAGCGTIIAVGGNKKSLELAKEMGATHAVNRKEVADVVAEIQRITNGKGLDGAVETSGADPMIKNAILSLGNGGQVALLAVGGNIDIPVGAILNNRSIKGIIEGEAVPKLFIPELVRLYKEGNFPFDKLVTYYDFDQINQAFEDSKSGAVIKPVLRISEV